MDHTTQHRGHLRAYQAIVAAVATEAPTDGYLTPDSLPPLTPAQRAALLRANPDVLNDLEVDATEIAAALEGDTLAAWLAGQLEPLLRRWLFWDVEAELEADESRRRADEADEMANAEHSAAVRSVLW